VIRSLALLGQWDYGTAGTTGLALLGQCDYRHCWDDPVGDAGFVFGGTTGHTSVSEHSETAGTTGKRAR